MLTPIFAIFFLGWLAQKMETYFSEPEKDPPPE